jgi:hypothetical protein
MGLKEFSLAAVFGAVAFELLTHVIVHYTVPGAAIASSIAQFLAPGLDAIGLTTIFSETAGETALAGLASDSPLLGLPGIGS